MFFFIAYYKNGKRREEKGHIKGRHAQKGKFVVKMKKRIHFLPEFALPINRLGLKNMGIICKIICNLFFPIVNSVFKFINNHDDTQIYVI